MRSIITTARYAEHLEAYSFAIFVEEREALVEDTWDIPTCDCCGEKIFGTYETREIARRDGWHYVEYDLCGACEKLGLTDTQVLQAFDRMCAAYQERRLREKQRMEERLRKLEHQHPNANWSVIYDRLRCVGYHFERCSG